MYCKQLPAPGLNRVLTVCLRAYQTSLGGEIASLLPSDVDK